jgi:glycosyltransferase involved in cell wall biosynthesis
MNKVLIICSGFLPVRNGGTIRCEKLVKYLPNFNWESVVLTKKPSKKQKLDLSYTLEYCKIYRTRCFDLASLLVTIRTFIATRLFFFTKKKASMSIRKEESTKVKRRISDYFLLPDADIFWALGAVLKGFFVLRNENPNIIFSSGPSQSVHIVGLILKKITCKKWVVEFRDPWTMNPFNVPKPFKMLTIIDNYLEKIVLKNADRINVTSIEYKNQFLKKYESISKSKIVTIPNGYDPEDFEGYSLITNEKFTIVHTGNFYQHRSSCEFVKAVLYLLENNLLPKENFIVKFVGILDDKGKDLIMKSAFSKNFNLLGQVPHKESIKELYNADLLLLIPGPGEGTIPGKFYEYLAVSKPIFCIANEGPPTDLINRYSLGIVSNDNDVQEIAEKFKLIYDSVVANDFSYPNIEEFKNNFNRKNIAKRMSVIFDEVIKSEVLDM